jgi:hypothetical protein
MADDPNQAMSTTKRSDEFREWDQKADRLTAELREERNKWGRQFRSLIFRRKLWQTAVVISTSISTGLAGYLVNQNTPFEWRLALAIIVAIAGAVSAVRDAWQVNEAADDARDRYLEIKTLATELERVRFEVAGLTRESETLPRLRGSVEHVRSRLDEISDDLPTMPRKPLPKSASAGQSTSQPLKTSEQDGGSSS